MPAPDEAELLDRFQRLNGHMPSSISASPDATTAASAGSGFQPALYSQRDLKLAGAGSGSLMNEEEQVEMLLQQLHDDSQLEKRFGLPDAHAAAAAAAASSVAAASASRSSAFCESPSSPNPVAARAEVDLLMRQLSGLPDTEALEAIDAARARSSGRRHEHTKRKKLNHTTASSSADESFDAADADASDVSDASTGHEDNSSDEDEGSEDTEARRIVAMAHDEASMEQTEAQRQQQQQQQQRR
jgi:hypothetical protein